MGFAVNRPYGLPNPRDSDSIRGRPVERRTFLQAAAATGLALARPAIAQGVKPLIFVPQGNLVSLDPIWTTAAVTRNYAMMVFETLFGMDFGTVVQRRTSKEPIFWNVAKA